MLFSVDDRRATSGRRYDSSSWFSKVAGLKESMAQSGKPGSPDDLRSELIPTRRKAAAAPQPAPGLVSSDEWMAGSAYEDTMIQAGIKPRGGGPHQSKTMMLAELTTLLASRAADRPADAIVRDNLLGKPSVRAREVALYRLRQLYGVGQTWPICVVLPRLWDLDPPGRPLLALLCALARDPSLQAGASAVLDASLGEPVRWPRIAAAFEARHPEQHAFGPNAISGAMALLLTRTRVAAASNDGLISPSILSRVARLTVSGQPRSTQTCAQRLMLQMH